MTDHEGQPTRPDAPAQLPWWWRGVVAYARRELPMWGRLYALAGGTRDARWRDAGKVTIRGKLHGYRMPLDLSNWSERLTYCLGRYHDLPLQAAILRVVRPGDTFVDVGANLGMIALLAARLVGAGGKVLACEPNPELAQHLAALRRDNELAQLEVVPFALGDTATSAALHEFAGHSGWGSLIATAPDGASESASWTVQVTTGDAVLRRHDREAPLTLKIDVEGYEVPALQGCRPRSASACRWSSSKPTPSTSAAPVTP